MSNPISTLKQANDVLIQSEIIKDKANWFKVIGKNVYTGSTRELFLRGVDVNDVSTQFLNLYGRVFNITSVLKM